MGQDTCAVPDCGRASRSRGWCETHYYRWYRHGDPHCVNAPGPGRPFYQWPTREERFWSYASIGGPADCWDWHSTRTKTGYGVFTLVRGRAIVAHRFAYQQMVGEIPEGLELDHLCRNRACVNPAHLEPVTHDENIRRGALARAAERPTTCSIEGCTDSGQLVRGWCQKHYTRWWRSGDPGEAESRLTHASECAVDGCAKGGPFLRGWCRMHYIRWYRNGSTG